jgi:1-acyl-sn-glycerol-3-phosphate acyltransferase
VAGRLSARERLGLDLQRAVGRLLSPIWVPATVALMRFGLRWHIEELRAVRAQYRALWRDDGGPVLVCANHLTLIDSALVAWALGSPGWFLTHYPALPWNVPERRNFADSLVSRLLVYLMKCVPVTRGGDRGQVGRVLARLVHLLGRGEAVLVFPEGGRSRSGRVEVENAAYGIGRVVGDLPGCRILCVYLRGEHQDGFSDLPRRGERFHVRLATLRPTATQKGLRGTRDVARQVVATLADLERKHFDAGQ